jgi:hypothetical protein
MKGSEQMLGELTTNGDSYEITAQGKTALARAERDGTV